MKFNKKKKEREKEKKNLEMLSINATNKFSNQIEIFQKKETFFFCVFFSLLLI